ncbi:D-hexose-6-phosphate mutarotase [Luteolibacter flavescens]|uniref:Putative glucose-6-phosphate 1-epimerase n=1 Tax=Luteolibacter flavescens TaxID=1859460 RepID=A0ABT3FKI8_9BACT|nr:D-hexose-6-phosphate mutarotase [Luteolibacter flavescens]MCW1884071.1 D-hexose-6-phosphate mutarotase [Luteolibacter flavescens]
MNALPACIRLTHPAEDYPVLEIDHPTCRARVALHGAHVMEWQPAGHAPVLYCSPQAVLREGKAIRGGIPICWPWFGAHPTDPTKPAHGIVRTRFWRLTDSQDGGESVELRFELESDDATRAIWGHDFHVIVEIRLGAELHLSLISHNTGETALEETGALHTYLAVDDIANVEVTGLEGVAYLDTAAGQRSSGVEEGAIRIDGEYERTYGSTATVTLRDATRTLHTHKHGSASTIVWSPGVEKAARLGDMPLEDFRRFLCIETANAPGAEVTVKPGGHHVLRTRITVS